MNVNSASNGADIQVDHQASNSADSDGMPDTTDPTDGNVFEVDDPANNTTDGDGMPNTTDTTDADIFEIITQTRTGGFPDLDLTPPNCEQIPSESAESDSLPKNPPNLVEPSSADTLPQVVVEYFPFGNPGVPINTMQDSSVYESRQEMFGGSVWAPFQSDSDWQVTRWAKINGISSSAVTELLAIPNVCSPPFFFYAAKCSLRLWRGLVSCIIQRTNSIQSSTICLAAHHSSPKIFSLETKLFNFIFGTLCLVSVQSLETPSLHGT